MNPRKLIIEEGKEKFASMDSKAGWKILPPKKVKKKIKTKRKLGK